MNLYKALTSLPFSPAFELQRVKLYTCPICGCLKTRNLLAKIEGYDQGICPEHFSNPAINTRNPELGGGVSALNQ